MLLVGSPKREGIGWEVTGGVVEKAAWHTSEVVEAIEVVEVVEGWGDWLMAGEVVEDGEGEGLLEEETTKVIVWLVEYSSICSISSVSEGWRDSYDGGGEFV